MLAKVGNLGISEFSAERNLRGPGGGPPDSCTLTKIGGAKSFDRHTLAKKRGENLIRLVSSHICLALNEDTNKR